MFELNLIKDKAKARQRRRLIFLCIVSIALLSGLSLIAIGSLFWRETTLLQTQEREIDQLASYIKEIEGWVATEGPKARKRRNAMIHAWNEDFEVLQSRPRFTPVLWDLYEYKPRNGDFWYNEFSIRAIRTTPTSGAQADQFALAKSLMGPRRLSGNGYIEIEQSDVMTENELADMTARMERMVNLVGAPRFAIELSQRNEGAALEGGRYVPFTVEAATSAFTGRGADFEP